jgi:hypothetical protein
MMLFGGWLLIMPPSVNDSAVPGRLRTDTPVAEWVQESAHDTAVACETARLTKIDMSRQHKQSAEGFERPWRVALCVPAGSVYPPKQ